MAEKYYVNLNYGYQECEDGIYHAFIAEDTNNLKEADHIAVELASLLDTTVDDQRFNWDCMNIEIPESVVKQIQQDAVQKCMTMHQKFGFSVCNVQKR